MSVEFYVQDCISSVARDFSRLAASVFAVFYTYFFRWHLHQTCTCCDGLFWSSVHQLNPCAYWTKLPEIYVEIEYKTPQNKRRLCVGHGYFFPTIFISHSSDLYNSKFPKTALSSLGISFTQSNSWCPQWAKSISIELQN